MPLSPPLESGSRGPRAWDSRLAAAMARPNRIRVAAICFSLTSFVGLLVLGLPPQPDGVVTSSVVLVVGCVPAGFVGGAAAMVWSRGFLRRCVAAIVAWGAIYLAVLLIGLILFPGDVVFWAVGALAFALPGLWIALTGPR